MKKFKIFIHTFLCVFCLVVFKGCGQTGDLYLPEEANNSIKYNEYQS